LYEENESFKNKLEDIDSNKLTDFHLKILSIANKEDEGINTYHLESLYKENPEYQIAFSELEDWDYIIRTNVYGSAITNAKTVECYKIYASKETEVLKVLLKAKIL
jgi:hypothetical protein